MSNTILTLIGPSCSGKTTLLNELVEKYDYIPIVSHTTRPPRAHEVDHYDYHFITPEEFGRMAANNEFVESIGFNGYFYGVAAASLEFAFNQGKKPVLIVEPNGLSQIQSYFKDTNKRVVAVYISGALETLMERYLARMNGEDLSHPPTLFRNAKRLASISHEHAEWLHHGAYSVIIHNFDKKNFQEIVDLVLTKVKKHSA